MKKVLPMLAVMVFILSAGLFTACQGEKSAEKKTAELTYVNWEEGVAYTHLAKVVLEDKMGYDVTITSADVALAFASVASGDQDAFMECWLPGTHDPYIEKYGEGLIDLGHVYEGTTLGLAVPHYMIEAGIRTLSDLKKPEAVEKLNKTITGIDAGAGMMIATEEKVMPAYGLDEMGYKLLPSSGPAMMAALKDAYQSEEWIVVTAWKPHSMFGYFNMQFLEQDDYQEWSVGNIHIMGRKELREDKPELAQFLANMNLTTEEVGSLMVALKESSKDEEEAAREWLAENEDVIADWIP